MKRPYIWPVVLLTITVLAFALRARDLGRRPMHHDEANQAVRAGQLLETGEYRYDPLEHHGPSLYYLSLPFMWASSEDFAGTSEKTFRALTVIAGVGLVLLLLLVVDGLGWPAVIAAGVLTAVSPAMVYYSRLYIQEMLLVFFAFGAIASGWRYFHTKKVGWAIFTGFFGGMMHATKETCVIAFGAMVFALVACYLLQRKKNESPEESTAEKGIEKRHLLIGVVTAVVVSVVLYSSFFTNWRGVLDSLVSYRCYLNRAGGSSYRGEPWYYYLRLLLFTKGGGLLWTEAFILVLAVIGCVGAIVPRLSGFANKGLLRFVALYTVAVTVIYALIPYKTPWCLISFLHGMILLAGIGAAILFQRFRSLPVKVVVLVVIVAGTMHLGCQARLATSRYSADERNPYVYVQTSTDFLKLARRVDEISDVSSDGRDMLIAVVTSIEDSWPLPWYLREYPAVGYWRTPADVPEDANPSLIVSSPDFDDALGDGYQREHYGLRPGVLLTLHIRSDLWGTFLETRK